MNHANSNRNKSVSESVSFDQRQIREDNRKRALSMTILCHSILTQSVISILTWLLLPFLFEYVLIGWSWLVAVSKKTTIFWSKLKLMTMCLFFYRSWFEQQQRMKLIDNKKNLEQHIPAAINFLYRFVCDRMQ